MGPSPNKRHRVESKTTTNERATMTIKRCKPKHLVMDSTHSKVDDPLELKQKKIQTKVSNFKKLPTRNKNDEGASCDAAKSFRMYDRKPNSFHCGESSASSRTSMGYSTDAYKSSLQSFHCDSFDESISSLCRRYPSSIMKRNHSQIHIPPPRNVYDQINSWKNSEEVLGISRMNTVLISGRNRQPSFSSDAEKVPQPVVNHVCDKGQKNGLHIPSMKSSCAQYMVDRNFHEFIRKPPEMQSSAPSELKQLSLSGAINVSPPVQQQNLSCTVELSGEDTENDHVNERQIKMVHNSESVDCEISSQQDCNDKLKSDVQLQTSGNGDGNKKLFPEVNTGNQLQAKITIENLSSNYPQNEETVNSKTEIYSDDKQVKPTPEEEQKPASDIMPNAVDSNIDLKDTTSIKVEQEHSNNENIVKDTVSQTDRMNRETQSQNQLALENEEAIANVVDKSDNILQETDNMEKHQNSQSDLSKIINVKSKDHVHVEQQSTFQEGVLEYRNDTHPHTEQQHSKNNQFDFSNAKSSSSELKLKLAEEDGDDNLLQQKHFQPSNTQLDSQPDLVKHLSETEQIEIEQKHNMDNQHDAADLELRKDSKYRSASGQEKPISSPPDLVQTQYTDIVPRSLERVVPFQAENSVEYDSQYAEQNAPNISLNVFSPFSNRDSRSGIIDTPFTETGENEGAKDNKAEEEYQFFQNEANELQQKYSPSPSFITPSESQLPLPPWVEPVYYRNQSSTDSRQFGHFIPNFENSRNRDDTSRLNFQEKPYGYLMNSKEMQGDDRAYPSSQDIGNDVQKHPYSFVQPMEPRTFLQPHEIPYESMSCTSCCCHAYNCVPPPVSPGQCVYQVCPVFPVYLNNGVEMVCHVPNRAPSVNRMPYGVNVISLPSTDFPTVHLDQGVRRQANNVGRGQNRFVNAGYEMSNQEMQNWNSLGNMRPAGLRSDETERYANNSMNADPQRASTSKGTTRQRPFVICYICGREFGSASIGIHEKQCLEKWRNENSQLPKHMRRAEPIKPQVIGQNESSRNSSDDTASKIPGSGKTNYNLDTLNDAAFASSQAQNIKCDKCGRTFGPDRLDLHRKNCRGFHKIV